MTNVLEHTKQQQILALGRLGWTLSRIQETTGVRRETISAYLKVARIPVRQRGRPSESKPKPAISPPPVSTDSGPPNPDARAEVSTDLAPVPQPGRAPSASACEPYRELIERALERGRNAMAIWQDLVDAHGFEARYASVRRFVQTLRRTAPEPHAVITTAPGEEAQVDYGDGPMVRHPISGKYRRTRLFVLTLGYSRKSVRLLVWQSSAQVWAELHERAFRRLGGTTRVVIYDYVSRHIIVVMCPPSICGGGRGFGQQWTVRALGGGHITLQREASQSRSAWSSRQTGVRRDESVSVVGGSHSRTAASLMRVLISA